MSRSAFVTSDTNLVPSRRLSTVRRGSSQASTVLPGQSHGHSGENDIACVFPLVAPEPPALATRGQEAGKGLYMIAMKEKVEFDAK